MKRGLGMWIMSKMVMLIFLFSLVLVLTLFMRVYSEKIISDTARSHTLLWGEVANGALLYRASTDSVYLSRLMEVREASRPYTVMVKRVSNERVAIFLAWGLHETEDEMTEDGIVAATAVSMPFDISDDPNGEILLFEGRDGEVGFREAFPSDTLIVSPSVNSGRDDTIIFSRNNTVFCVGTVKEGVPVEASVERLGECCYGGWEDNSNCI
ncbi:hypothetical protein ACFLQ2_00885 [archaeon]